MSKNDSANLEKLKFAGAAIIIAAAAIIMAPGIFSYLAGLGRLLVLVGITLVSAVTLALLFRHFAKLKNRDDKTIPQQDSKSVVDTSANSTT